MTKNEIDAGLTKAIYTGLMIAVLGQYIVDAKQHDGIGFFVVFIVVINLFTIRSLWQLRPKE